MNNNFSGHILVIDPDLELTQRLTECLESQNFQVTCAYDGTTGLKKALNQSFDAIILEIMLPQMNGFEVLKTLRKQLETPVLVLTGRSDDIDLVVGFEIGADDYLTKPCNPHELTARLRAVLRRTQKIPTQRPVLTHKDMVIDCSQRTVTLHGKPLELTNTEFNIIEMLMKAPHQAFSKEELTEYALGRRYTAYDRSIDVHISNLRTKLGEDWVKTIRGFGYIIAPKEENGT
jgi:two-component system response regulator CpxR